MTHDPETYRQTGRGLWIWLAGGAAVWALGSAVGCSQPVSPEGYRGPSAEDRRMEWAGKSAQGERLRGRNWKLKCERKRERCGPES